MGLGVKVTATRRIQDGNNLIIPAIALCRAEGLGGEAGYGVLSPSKRVRLIYDMTRSPARFVNQPDRDDATTAKLCISSRHPWLPCVRALTHLAFGSALLMRYGAGSTHHATMAMERTERERRSPACNQKRQELKERMAALAKRRRV